MKLFLFASIIVILFICSINCSVVKKAIDPDINRNITELIKAKGYPVEEHSVETEDGYILGLFRIPHAKNNTKIGKPVLLFHGLIDSAFTWVINYPQQSLAYILADEGYDVWLGNVRGNRYSQKHKVWKNTQPEFWKFTFDQHAKYDLPNTIDYILQKTNQKKLSYIGHSQGTMMIFMGYNVIKNLDDKLNLFVGLGPVARVKNMNVWGLRVLASIDFDEFLEEIGEMAFFPKPDTIIKYLGEYFCYYEPVLCEDIIEILCGKHQGAFNESRMDVMVAHEPGGTSVLNIVHWGQFVRHNIWSMFNYGNDKDNMKHYNSTTPPLYSLSAVTGKTPIALIYGGKDLLADPEDVLWIIQKLKVKPVFVQYLPEYAHLDFVWDITAYKEVYPNIIKLLKQYNV